MCPLASSSVVPSLAARRGCRRSCRRGRGGAPAQLADIYPPTRIRNVLSKAWEAEL